MKPRKKIIVDDILLSGKIPPQAPEIEEAILGGLMLEKTAYNRIATEITEDDFYKDSHKVIFKSISKLANENKNVDMLTVSDALRAENDLDNAGGLFALMQLTSNVASTAHLESHALIVKQHSTHRRFIQSLSERLSSAWNQGTDIYELIKETQSELDNLTLKKDSSQLIHVGKSANQVYIDTENARNNPNTIMGIKSSLREINEKLMGYCEPDLIIVAGRPGEGKSTYAIQEALFAAENGSPSLVFSMEMKDKQLAWKILSQKANIEVLRIRSGKITVDELNDLAFNAQELQATPLYFADGVNNLNDIKSISRRAVKSQGIKFIVIDYLGLISYRLDGANREQVVSEICRQLKALCIELSVPIMLLCQLSRPTKGTTVKPPTIFDLKESGGIESNADVIIFPHRPSYYGVTQVDGIDGIFTENMALIDVAKQRLGNTGHFVSGWDGAHSKFYNYSEFTF
jgi:replicative DNA helicase